MFEGISIEEQIKIIRKEFYKNKSFIYPEIQDENKINTKIAIQVDDKIIIYEECNCDITLKDFQEKLQNKYQNKKISMDCDDEHLDSKLIDFDTDNDFLKVKKFQTVELKIQGRKPLIISKTNTIEGVLEMIFPERSIDEYFIFDGELITNKKELVSKYSKAKTIKILDLTRNPITLEIKCKNLKIDPILVDSKNINMINSLEDLKKRIIELAKINRKARYLTVNNDRKILIKDEMIGPDQKIMIPLNVSFMKCPFYIQLIGSKKRFIFEDEKISVLKDKFKCDKIKLLNDKKVVDDNQSFLFLTPNKDYDIQLFDEYYIFQPQLKEAEDSEERKTSKIELERYKTFGTALSSIPEFENIPYKIYDKNKDITNNKINEKLPTSEYEPLTLKIAYEFHIIKKDDDDNQSKTIDDLNQNVKKYIIDNFYDSDKVTEIGSIIAKIKNKDEEVQKIENDDKFGNLNYQKGYVIEVKLLPPKLEYKDDIEDIQMDENIYIDEEDEKHHEIIKKLGEGATSIAYKIVDKRTNKIMCKKVIKIAEEKSRIKIAQNSLKEFQVLHNIDHPCICKSFGINTQEKILDTQEEVSNDYNQENKIVFEDDDDIEKKAIIINKGNMTTIALFLEFLEVNLKDLLSKNILTNTMKVKIAVEVAFAMDFLHKLGMIHRDLKIENIMLNSGFEAKIIDFDLVHVSDSETDGSQYSLTKGIGTLAYMSPEMQNEDEYDSKTDVYSYGVVLHVIFTGILPKLKMKDKLDKIPPNLPKPSYPISKVCIDLIRKCMEFEPANRPSFDEILDYMEKNEFQLASEVDAEIISRRYRKLNKFNTLHIKLQQNK